MPISDNDRDDILVLFYRWRLRKTRIARMYSTSVKSIDRIIEERELHVLECDAKHNVPRPLPFTYPRALKLDYYVCLKCNKTSRNPILCNVSKFDDEPPQLKCEHCDQALFEALCHENNVIKDAREKWEVLQA